MPDEKTIDRMHMLERAAALLADYALATGLDASEFRGMCEEAFENAVEGCIDADAENRAGTFRRPQFPPIQEFKLGVLPVVELDPAGNRADDMRAFSDCDGGFSLHLIEGGKRG